MLSAGNLCEKNRKATFVLDERAAQKKEKEIKSKEFNRKRFRFPTIVWFIYTI